MASYASRRLTDRIMMLLCWAAALFGLTWLALILVTLFWNGFAGLTGRCRTDGPALDASNRDAQELA